MSDSEAFVYRAFELSRTRLCCFGWSKCSFPLHIMTSIQGKDTILICSFLSGWSEDNVLQAPRSMYPSGEAAYVRNPTSEYPAQPGMPHTAQQEMSHGGYGNAHPGLPTSTAPSNYGNAGFAGQQANKSGQSLPSASGASNQRPGPQALLISWRVWKLLLRQVPILNWLHALNWRYSRLYVCPQVGYVYQVIWMVESKVLDFCI